MALGHQRLSIIDLEGGSQPLSNENEQLWISFNGEIFNFQSLRATLVGHRFKTRTDTEVIVHGIEQFGIGFIPKLNGMFAFALWNEQDGSLILARDRSGIKPLYYSCLPNNGIVFASELTALLEHPLVSKEIDIHAIISYFFLDYFHPPRTVLRKVSKLIPGTYLRWKDGVVSGPISFCKQIDGGTGTLLESDDKITAQLFEKLSLAVERQLIADVPVGIFLSGGIDSSVVAALAQRSSKKVLYTFSISFEEKDYDESPYARTVASHLKTHHTEQCLTETNLLDNLDVALDSLDEPLADASLLPTFMLSRLAATSVKVVLGGDGGDELWAGYPTYQAHAIAKIYAKIPRLIRDRVFAPAIDLLPTQDTYQSLEWKLKRFSKRWDEDLFRRHLRWMSNTDILQLRKLFPSVQDEPEVLRQPPSVQSSDILNALLLLDYHTYLPGSVLAKVDRASMANGLEVRPPFLDNELVNWSARVPSKYKLRHYRTKYLLKKVALKFLPRKVVMRRKKGFAIPLSRWLVGPLKQRIIKTLVDSPLWDSQIISRSTLMEWNNAHQERKGDFSKPLWAMLVLDHWLKKENIHVT